MARKRKQIAQEKIKAAEKLQELQRLEEEAKQEEETMLAEVREKIEKLCADNGLFCGMILTPRDLGTIVEMAASSPDKQTQLPFNLYPIDSE